MILVTGASGFIGSHFLRRASSLHPIRCLVRRSSLSKITPMNSLEIFEGDLLNQEDIQRAVRGVKMIVHLGALLRTKKPGQIMRVNVEGTHRLVEAAKKESVKRFVFISSENAMREDLCDAYAVSKREAEKIVRTFENSLILRPCFVYGAGDDHGLGKLVEIVERSPIVPLFLNLRSQIQPMYIDDAVEYLMRAVSMNIRGAAILAGPEKINLNDFLKKVCEVRKKRKLFIPLPPFFLNAAQRKNIYGSRTYSIEKTVSDFEYSPRGIEAGLRLWFKRPAASVGL